MGKSFLFYSYQFPHVVLATRQKVGAKIFMYRNVTFVNTETKNWMVSQLAKQN